MYPVKDNFQSGQGINQISADYLNTVANMLNGLSIEIVHGVDIATPQALVSPPNQAGQGWKIRIPISTGLPSNAGKSKYMGIYLTADNDTETDNPALWAVDWLRAHA